MEPPNIFEEINYHMLDIKPDAETLWRRGFDVFTFNSKEFTKNATLSERKIYQILMDDYFQYEKVPDTNAFLSLFPVIPVLNSQETESSSLREIEEESETDYIPFEEDFEFTPRKPKNSLSKRSSDSTSFDSNTVQNKMKNNQGTIAGKIKKSCKVDRKTGRNTRLFEEAAKNLTEDKKEKFRKYALSYKKTFRTWSKLKEFLSLNAEFGGLFAKMAILLLSEDFKNEYEECIIQGQMGEKTKDLLREQSSKDFYIEKFSLMINILQGNPHDFENEIKKHRKFLKKI